MLTSSQKKKKKTYHAIVHHQRDDYSTNTSAYGVGEQESRFKSYAMFGSLKGEESGGEQRGGEQ